MRINPLVERIPAQGTDLHFAKVQFAERISSTNFLFMHSPLEPRYSASSHVLEVRTLFTSSSPLRRFTSFFVHSVTNFLLNELSPRINFIRNTLSLWFGSAILASYCLQPFASAPECAWSSACRLQKSYFCIHSRKRMRLRISANSEFFLNENLISK